MLQKLGGGFARTDGEGRLGVLATAEALGEEEMHAGRPLVGRAGQLFNRMVSRTQDPVTNKPFSRDDFLLANVVNCRPPDNVLTDAPYEDAAIAHCSPYLRETIQKFKPRAVLAMGNTPLRWLTGHEGINAWRGYIIPTVHGLVVPTYHPSFIMRGNMRLAKVFQHDLKKAVKVAREGHVIAPVDYLIRPSVAQAQAWLEAFLSEVERNPDIVLAYDIETPYSSQLDEDEAAEEDASYIIERISFSYRERTGISMPWMPPFTDIARRALAAAKILTVWNSDFDTPRLEHNGAPINGVIHDAMWAWHLSQPEWPYGLKYAATFHTDLPQWKHMSKSAPEYYSVVDSDALLRCYVGIKRDLQKTGQWDTYLRHVVDLGMVLRKMSRRGVLVSLEKRAIERKKFAERYDEMVKEITSMVPKEVLPKHPKEGYKKTEAQLRKAGIWEEGRMVQIGEMEVKDPKPPKEKKPRKPRKKKGAPDDIGGEVDGTGSLGVGLGDSGCIGSPQPRTPLPA